MPDNAINSLKLSSGTDPVAFVNALLTASSANPFTLSMNISYSLTVFSPNYIDIQVKSINTDLFLVDSKTNQVIGGKDAVLVGKSDIGFENFSKLANTTINPFLLISYSRSTPLSKSTSDAVLFHLFNTCVNPTNTGPRKLKFKYTTVLDIKIISFTGYKPTVSDYTTVSCPDLSGLAQSWKILDQLPLNFGSN